MNKSNLESLLTTKDNVHNTMTEYEMKENFVIHDIVDGISYRELNKPGAFLSYRYAFSGIFNTDGIPLFSSTKEKLWPIFIAINEFPVSQRFCRENLILAGIWQGKGNPPFFQYISAFGQEMSKLYFDGFTLDNEDKILVKFGVLAGTLDLQAKGYVANMTMHNGAFGCITCEEEGRTVRQGKGTARCYPFRSEDEQKPIRAHMTFVNESLTANHQNRIKGICGPSGLIAMPWYDIIVGTVPDYMHGTLLGVTKHLLQKFLSPKNSNKPFFVGKNIQAISKRMTSIKPPDFVERVPRDLEKNYQNFKATELQAWLLYYSLPCLHGFLPDVYLKHLALLSEGIYILLSDNITSQDLQKAKENLSKFYKDFAILYGEGSSGLNVHNIGQHLVFYVQHWGPIFAWSCFGFEDANANILSFAHGTKDVTKQILGMKEAHMIVHSTSISPDTACGAFFKNMNKRFSKKWKHTQEMNNCSIAGAVKPFVLPNYSTSEFVNTFCNSTDISLLRSALRVEVNNEKYYGKDYTKMKTKVSYVALCEGGNIVEIQSFILNTVTNHVYALVLRLDISQQTFLYVAEGHHIMCVEKTNDVVILGVNKLKEKLFYMEVGNKKYVARVPNVHGRGVLK
ncbi:unnamed protein product [Mytilus edulis]|uniref:Uncharacterized protein n=2 Tax=Mytilus edulis TaxID=6550 RepID=A0A8S3RXW4_MYTED|nr:unnamed protein product [Mytilus edulis]